MKKQFLEIGKIVGTHGLNGEVRVEMWCDSPEFFCGFNKLYFESGKKEVFLKSRPHKRIAIAKIKDIDSIDAAEELRGRVLYMNRDDARLEEGAHFIQDLIGLSVVDADTQKIYGKITDVLKTGANDVYQVTEDKKSFLLPVIPDVVKSVNIDDGTVMIRPIKGIFDDED